MKTILLLPIMIVAGGGVGGGAGLATARYVAPPAHADAAAEAEKDAPALAFVKAEKILAPLVMKDGRLAGYVSFEADLEVPADEVAAVTLKLPLLLHAVNMRTYRTPLAAGPDGMLPDIAAIRTVVAAAADEAFGKKVVHRVAITRADPA